VNLLCIATTFGFEDSGLESIDRLVDLFPVDGLPVLRQWGRPTSDKGLTGFQENDILNSEEIASEI
jgi:hypothetical protein